MHPDPINLDANLDVVDPGVVGLTKEFFYYGMMDQWQVS